MAAGIYNFVTGGIVCLQGDVGTKGKFFSGEWFAKQFCAFFYIWN